MDEGAHRYGLAHVMVLRAVRFHPYLVWVALAGACVTAQPPPAAPPPNPAVIQQMGYDEAVQLGASYAQQMGYLNGMLEEAVPEGTNWRIRFGLKDKKLVLQLDSHTRRLMKAEEQSGIGAHELPPEALPGTPSK